MDFKKIMSDSAVSTLRTLLFVGRRLLVLPLLTKLIDVGSYGFWATTIGFVLLFGKIGGLQMQNAFIRYTSMESDEAGTVGGTFLLTVVGAAIAAAGFVLFVVLTGFLERASFEGTERTILLGTITVMVFARTLYSYLSNYPRALGRVKEFEAIRLLELVFEVIAITLALYLTRSVVWGMLALGSVYVLTDVALLFRYVDTEISIPSFERLRKYFEYSFPLIFKGVSSMLLANADKFLLLYFLSPTAAGIYAAAYSICGVFRSLSTVLNPTLYPAVSAAWDDDDMEDLETLYKGILVGYVLLAVPAFVGLTLVAPGLIQLLSTEAVGESAVFLVPIIGFGLMLRAFETPLSFVLKADEKTSVLGLSVVVAALLNFGLNIYLIPKIELFGAAVATLVAEAFILFTVFWYARTLLNIELPVLILVKAGLASAVMALVLVLLPLSRTGLLFLVMAPPFGVLVYFAVMYVTNGIPEMALNRIRKAAR